MRRLGAAVLRSEYSGPILGLLLTGVIVDEFSSSNLYVYDTILLTAMGAIALQVLQGTAGLVSVGNAGFLLIGSFGSVLLLRAGAPFPIDLVGATLMAGVGGLVTGLPALRLRSLFVVLATLAMFFVTLFFGILYENHVPSARNAGFVVPVLFASKGLKSSAVYWAWLLTAILGIVVIGAGRLVRYRTGRAMRMLRDHEFVTPSFGIPVIRAKLWIFFLTSMLIGFQGALLAHFNGSVLTDNFTLELAFSYVVMIVIGGLDSLLGAVVGAAVVVGLPAWVPLAVGDLMGGSEGSTLGPNVALIVYGVLVIAFVTSSPDGMVGLSRRLGLNAYRRLRHDL